MGSKSHPSVYDCFSNAHPDEPMFVLLGRDRIGGALTRLWAAAREQMGEDPPKVAEAHDCAALMDAWCRAAGKVPAEILDLLPFELLEAAIRRRSGVVTLQVQGMTGVEQAAALRVPLTTALVLTGQQIEALTEMAAGEAEAEINVGFGDGHAGHGLYAWYAEYPEEGAIALFEKPETPEQPAPLDLASDKPIERKCEPTGNGDTCEACQ